MDASVDRFEASVPFESKPVKNSARPLPVRGIVGQVYRGFFGARAPAVGAGVGGHEFGFRWSSLIVGERQAAGARSPALGAVIRSVLVGPLTVDLGFRLLLGQQGIETFSLFLFRQGRAVRGRAAI